MQQITILSFILINTLCIAQGQFFFDRETRRRRQGFDGSQCRTPLDEQGTCINIRRCPSLLSLLKTDPNAKQFLRQSQCGFEGSDPKVCCKQETSRATTPLPSDNNSQFPERCGRSEVAINRIVGGRIAELRTWPWMAALGFRSNSNRQQLSWNCGGALVNSRYVVTAAHCISGNRRVVMVRLGDLDLATTADNANHIDVPVERQISHPQYNSVQHTSDIALIKLRNSVRFNSDVQPICLPFSQELRSKDLVGFSPFIAGWGAMTYDSRNYTTKLYEAQVEVRTLEDCRGAYYKLPNNRAVIDERVVCAGGGRQDTCQGDSGGPLMMPEQGVFYLLGVVSYGYKCAEPGYPGVYTKVGEHLDWIRDTAA